MNLGLLTVATAATPPVDYVGIYDGGVERPTEIVAASKLFAVVMEAKYPLTEVAPAPAARLGLRLHFMCEHGRLPGYMQNGVFHPRLLNTASLESLALARPRPIG